jgi:type II secretory pathway pseudopilin PulG
MTKQGAMFGLDARIALAIFGALSVISGAALYSAIKEAKITAYVTELNEIAKAYEAYYLDTGSQVPAVDSIWLKIENLVKNDNIDGWKGPYLPYKVVANNDLEVPNFPSKSLKIPTFADVDFGDSTNATACTATDCYAYIFVGGFTLADAEAIDEKIDGEVDHLKGNIKVYGSAPTKNVYYKAFNRVQ